MLMLLDKTTLHSRLIVWSLRDPIIYNSLGGWSLMLGIARRWWWWRRRVMLMLDATALYSMTW